MSDQSSCSWSCLDRNSLLHVLSFLRPCDLAALQAVNKELRDVAGLNTLWLPLVADDFGLALQVGTHPSKPPARA